MLTYRTLIIVIVFVLGTLITIKSMRNGWYKNSGIVVSSSQPPNYVFSIVWIFLYILYAVIWEYLAKHKLPKWLNTLFIINMILNLTWTYVFFGYGDIAFSKVIILLLLILTYYQAYAIKQYTKAKYSGACAFSILFYAAWLTVATGLNFDIKY